MTYIMINDIKTNGGKTVVRQGPMGTKPLVPEQPENQALAEKTVDDFARKLEQKIDEVLLLLRKEKKNEK